LYKNKYRPIIFKNY